MPTMHSTQHPTGRRSRTRPLRVLAGTIGVATLVGLGVTAGLAAASSPRPDSRVAATSSRVIYVIGYEQDNPFWVLEGDGASAAGSTFGVTVRYEAPTTASDAGMVSLIDAALATHPYGIAIDYTDKTMQAPVTAITGCGRLAGPQPDGLKRYRWSNHSGAPRFRTMPANWIRSSG